MKKQLLLLSASALFAWQLQAQTIPNNSFENWTTKTNSFGSYTDLDGGWKTNNELATFWGTTSAEKVADPKLGSYALKLTNFIGKKRNNSLEDSTWGASATIDFKGDGNVPAKLRGTVKYDLQPGEIAFIQFGTGLEESNGFRVLGIKSFQGSSNNQYVSFEINTFPTPLQSHDDSLSIFISAYDPYENRTTTVVAGSTFQVDSLFFEGTFEFNPKISQNGISNGNFESWTPFGANNIPDNWYLAGELTEQGALPVYRSSDAHSGTYSLGLGAGEDGFGGAIYSLFVPSSGSRYLVGHSSFALGEDTVFAYLGKYTAKDGFVDAPIDTVVFLGTSNGFEPFHLDFGPNVSNQDTLVIVFGYSPSENVANTRLSEAPFFLVDDLSTETVLGLENRFVDANQLKAYPNPSKDGIFYLNRNLSSSDIRVTDATGNALQNIAIEKFAEQTKIDLSKANKGVYFVTCQDKTFKLIY